MTDRDRLIEAGAHIDRTLCGGGPVCESCLEYVSAVLDALTATPELAGVLARYAAEKAGEGACTCRVTGPDPAQTRFDKRCPFHGEAGTMVAPFVRPGKAG